jgi:hypothetical protein
MSIRITILIVLLALAGCSVLPKKVVPASKQKAYQFLEQARKEELKANYTDALTIYQEAERNAILCCDFNAQLVALQGKARISYLAADTTAYLALLSNMSELVSTVNPAFEYRIMQIRFWEYFRSGDYARILQTQYDESKLPFYVRVEVLSYKVQAQAYLRQTNPTDNAKLSDTVKTYYRKFKRSKNLQAEMISNAYYALAFSDASAQQYSKAIYKLKKAMLLDRDYDLYIQLADDYALCGLCEAGLGNVVKARAYYTIAFQMYSVLNIPAQATKMQANIADLTGEKK